MLLGACQVVQVVGILLAIEQLFDGASGPGEVPLGRVHLVGVGEAIKLMAYFTPVGPHGGLVVAEVRHVVPYVEVAFVPHGAGEVAHFVHPVAMSVYVFARLGVLVSEEGPALHVLGNRRAGQAQYGGAKIDEGDQAIQG